MPQNQPTGPTIFPIDPNDRRFARLDINKANEDVRVVLAKLVSTNSPGSGQVNGRRAISVPNDTYIKRISDSTAASIADSESLFQLLPDTELAMQILISSILSPKDMVNTSLTYSVEAGAMETELVGAMLKVVEEYFDKSYKIKKLLTPILQDCLFMTGSYPLLILPENTIDDAINSPARVTMESLRGVLDSNGQPLSMGFLGPATKPSATAGTASLESIYGQLPHANHGTIDDKVKFKDHPSFESHLSVVDNFSVLKMRMLRDKTRQDRVQDMISMRHSTMRTRTHFGLEAEKQDQGATTAEVQLSLYKKRRYKNVPVLGLTPSDMLPTASVGHPMVMHLPSESVIPVHVPSNPVAHIGYFIMVDQNGNPVVKAQMADYYTDMSANMNSQHDMVNQLIATTKRAEKGREVNNPEADNEIIKAYTDLVEEDLLNRLRNGIYGDDVEISKPQEVYRVMLARALAQMQTKLLYVPAELMTYIAFDYNRYGVGKSLLEKSRILGSIRAILLFANTMSMIKNSVARELLNITLDPNDKDPSATVEFLIHEYAKTRSASYPIGASNPLDIVNFLQNAGVQVAVSGNTGYPETKFEVEDKASNKTKPDTELMNELRDQHIMSMGLSPETVTAGANVEFATTIVSSNLLLTKRVMQYQETFCDFVQEHVQKYIMYSGYLMNALREVVKNNKTEAKKKSDDDAAAAPPADPTATPPAAAVPPPVSSSVLDRPDRSKVPGSTIITDSDNLNKDRYGDDAVIFEFIKALKVALPAPDTASLETQMKSFELYSTSLEVGLKAYLNPEFMDESTMGDLAPTVLATIAVVKAYFQRQWLRTNNVMPELDALTNLGSDNDPFDLLEMQTGHIEGIQKSMGAFMRDLKEKLTALGLRTGVPAAGTAPGADPFGAGADPNELANDSLEIQDANAEEKGDDADGSSAIKEDRDLTESTAAETSAAKKSDNDIDFSGMSV
jgi:hypothetical protein